MMPDERDWNSWSALWRGSHQAVDPTPLQAMVASYRRRLAAVVCGEILLVAGFAWLSWVIVRDGVVLWEAVWLSTLWIFTAVAVLFAWGNQRGAWRAIAGTVADYQRQQAARRTRSLRFAFGLLVAEVAVVGAQLAWFGRFTPAAGFILAAFALAFGARVFWMKQQAVIELPDDEAPEFRKGT